MPNLSNNLTRIRWTRSATRYEMVHKDGGPAIVAITTLQSGDDSNPGVDGTRNTSSTNPLIVEHTLWVSGPCEVTLTTRWLTHNSGIPMTHTPHAPYYAYTNGETLEPCLLLAMFLGELRTAVRDTTDAYVDDGIADTIKQYHSAMHKKAPK